MGISRTFQGRVKSHGAEANEQIPYVRNNEDWWMSVQDAIPNTLEAEIHEDQVRQCVDKLGTIRRDVIVLSVSAILEPTMSYREALLTSSHQFKVEVCSPQMPSRASR